MAKVGKYNSEEVFTVQRSHVRPVLTLFHFSPSSQDLTFSDPIFLPTAYSRALICFGRERGWWIICNYPTVLKEKNMEIQKEYNLRYLLTKVRTT
jgi:hypothetical protein